MNKSSAPAVTVLMPAYNAGPYIREAIDSILSQTYTDFEFLIVNDGSTDDTRSIISSYTDPRIRIINQKNKGLIDTLNEGISISKGDIIARMDADDVCLPNRLEEQLRFLEQHSEYVMVGSEADVMDKDGNFLLHLEPIGYSHGEIKQRINDKCPFIHPCVTFYKQAVIQAGLYPKNALTFEDHLLWKRLLEVGKVCNLKQVLLKVRFNPESVTVDEKWRGKKFIDIRQRSVINGHVSDADAKELKALIQGQNFSNFKQASYYAMVAKKYLWNNIDSIEARKNLSLAIKHYPQNINSYALYLFSFVPGGLRRKIYEVLKKK